jgi:hypothetical protein
LIADVALPTFFEYFPRTEIDAEVPFGGWALRGPLALPCRWDGRQRPSQSTDLAASGHYDFIASEFVDLATQLKC